MKNSSEYEGSRNINGYEVGCNCKCILKQYVRYRYDTETGLYYLQSRYYNPEWGRFINADAIAGQVGELLGHNLFAYCKNNPINKQDPSGLLNYAASDGSGVDIPKPILSVIITSAATGAAANATDNYVNNTTLNPSTVNEANNALKEVGVNRSSRRALVRNIPKELRDLEIPAEGILKYQKVVGLLGTALYGLVAIEDWKNNLNLKDRAISIGIDTLGLGAGVVVGGIIGVMNAPVLVSAALVFGAGYFINKGTSSMKNKFNVN